jgi:hypothetical protein
MKFWQRWFSKTPPVSYVAVSRSWLRYPPSTKYARMQHPREYVRLMHASAKHWKQKDRCSLNYCIARAEARLAEWVYHAWRYGTDYSLLEARIKNFPKGWAFYTGSPDNLKQLWDAFHSYAGRK